MELRKLKVTRTGNRSTVTKKTEKYEGFEEFSRENLLSVYKDLKQKRKLMENLDEQILDQTTEEEEIENEIIVTDEYNTELDIRLRRFIEFTDNKFANVTGEKQDFLKSNDENGAFHPHEINEVSSDHTKIPFVRDHYPVSMPSGSLSTAFNHKLPKLSLPSFNRNKLAIILGFV